MEGKTTHKPVLLFEIIEHLNIKKEDIVVDATCGQGGYSTLIAKQLDKQGQLVIIDLDSHALLSTHRRVSVNTKAELFVIEDNFKNLKKILEQNQIKPPSKIVFDLGWNLMQLQSGKGFSFQKDEPLLMTYSNDSSKYIFTAKDVVNTWEEENIADILYHYGEERFSKRIARAIVESREQQEIKSSVQLAEIVKNAYPSVARWRNRIHPATKTFQAIRIVVNDEIGSIRSVLEQIPNLVAPQFKVAFVTFHSIEDRLIKKTFRDWEEKGYGKRYNKKVIKPTFQEITQNPSARSAKLRIFTNN